MGLGTAISASLLAAICMVESGGDAKKVGDNGDAIGAFQIHKEVVTDVNRVFKTRYTWPDDCFSIRKSSEICRLYLGLYGTRGRLGREVQESDLARIWNGGPMGYEKRSTLQYWRKVQKAMK